MATAKEAKNYLILNVSTRTVQRRAVDHDLRSYTRANKPFFSEKNKKNWTILQWKSVLCSDESKFNLHGLDGRHYVRRPKDEKFNPRYTRGTVKQRDGNVMVWSCL